MKITQYLNQTAEWQQRSGTDEWGKQLTGASTQIRVRFQKKAKQYKTKAGIDWVEITEYMTEAEVEIGDYIDGQEIGAVEHIQDFKKTIGRKCYPIPPSSFGGS